jgi:hypothetical protein
VQKLIAAAAALKLYGIANIDFVNAVRRVLY